MRSFLAWIGILGILAASHAHAARVGELHRVAADPAAGLRDAGRRPVVRVTIWYPAAEDAVEHAIVIGPPGKPLFDVGSAALNAAFAPGDDRRPVILLSHGYGGSARMMGWFGMAMARDGYIVVAVDHPGNNAVDAMTVAGALLRWDRVEDLRAALTAMKQDQAIAPHMDLSRVGAAGFSVGGFTALMAAGARDDPVHFTRFCSANPSDSVCLPQREFSLTEQDREDLFKRPEIQADAAHAGDDRAIPEVRAAFVMAPAVVQALEPTSLEHMRMPVGIILGDADPVAPPATNGLAAAGMIPNVSLIRLPGVGHYDFLSSCTESGRAIVPVCQTSVPQDHTHQQAIEAAKAFFGRQLTAVH